MHTALECEVTIKPRFVYIPSPRTGPVRGGGCESRDGGGVEREARTGESGPGLSGIRALQSAAAAAAASRSGARGGLRVGRRGCSCALWAAAAWLPGGLPSACGAPRSTRPPVEAGDPRGPWGSDRWAGGGGWGLRAGGLGAEGGVGGGGGDPAAAGWEDPQPGLGRTRGGDERPDFSCRSFPPVSRGVGRGAPRMEPRSRCSAAGG